MDAYIIEHTLAMYNRICEDISELQEGNDYRFFAYIKIFCRTIYYEGKIIPCSRERCKDLEVVSAWDRSCLGK